MTFLKSDSGCVSCSSYNLVFLEGFPFWNSEVISREFSSRYQTPYHLLSLTDVNIRTVIIKFSIHLPSIYTHKGCLMNLCGICNLFT